MPEKSGRKTRRKPPIGRNEAARKTLEFERLYDCARREALGSTEGRAASDIERDVDGWVIDAIDGLETPARGFLALACSADYEGWSFPFALQETVRARLYAGVTKATAGDGKDRMIFESDFGRALIDVAVLGLGDLIAGAFNERPPAAAALKAQIHVAPPPEAAYDGFVAVKESNRKLEDEPDIEWLEAIRRALARDSSTYADVSNRFLVAERAFREAAAKRLEDPLNLRLREMPHETIGQKQALARWLNEELRRLDLAIKCPKTGRPSTMMVGPGNHPEIGRFMIEYKDDTGKRIRSLFSPALPHVELTEASPRREALIEWRDRVSRSRTDIGRS